MSRRMHDFLTLLLVVVVSGTILPASLAATGPPSPPLQGYGVAVADITAAPAAAKFGFSWVKSFVRWTEVQIAPDRPYWWGNLGHVVGTAAQNGLHLLIRVDGAPAWVRPDGTSETGPVRLDRLDDWVDFLQAMAAEARRWRQENNWHTRIAYEIWNEPNLSWEWGDLPPDPAHYTAMLQRAYAAVKAGDPDALVVSAGLATTGGTADGLNVGDLSFIQGMYEAGAQGHFDALGSHPYGFAYPPEQDPAAVDGLAFRHAEQQRAIMEAFGDDQTSIWATGFSWLMNPAERGVTCHWPDRDWQRVSEIEQAGYLVRAFVYARQHWPWMGPMFLPGLDLAGLWYYDECEPMGWYALADADADWHPRTAEQPYDATPRLAQTTLTAFLTSQTAPAEAHLSAGATTDIHLGYGINISDPNHHPWASDLGLNWVKLYNLPSERLPFSVLLRLRGNWADYDDRNGYCGYVQGAAAAGLGKVEAYEIGNEPNLDWAWSEGAPGTELPDPAEYTAVLKKAYQCIKSVAPDAIVVSGALATVGPYDRYEDPPAYPHAWNDLKFLQAMYDNGAKDYFDAFGSHPYGFFFPPEQDPGGWADNPIYGTMYVDGLAFRRAEQQREVMVANGDGDKQIWATEWGWLLREDGCQSDWQDQGRWWQVVDEATQAGYIQRAFAYAYDHWPWMGPMFLFNLDFSQSPGHDDCDAVRYYAIRDQNDTPRQAYDAVRDMVKWPYAVVPDTVSLLIPVEALGTYTRTVRINNIGAEPLTYTVSTDTSWLTVPSGVFTGSGAITLTLDTTGFAAGTTYTGPVTVTTNGGLSHVHRPVTVTVLVAPEVHHLYLPLILKRENAP
ncbi:MAG: cellulase family glycosylhydrolase [Anaerolineae bacterium]|nr:MAG: cellulase family glycosylhydrolase [Anaerolineae bacterium]